MSMISYRITRVRCPECGGGGKVARLVDCPTCMGDGKARQNDLLYRASVLEVMEGRSERVQQLLAMAHTMMLRQDGSKPLRRWPD